MIRDPMTRLLQNPVGFLGDVVPEEEVAISSRVRLARNLKEFPFPPAASPEQMTAIRDLSAGAAAAGRMFGTGACRFDVAELSTLDQEILFERRLASRDLLTNPVAGTVLARADETLSVMINEEDHLRIQAIRPGLALDAAWQDADRLDTKFSSRLEFAFDEKLGYLTSCPTNVGTGMRASVMLHLPGLVMSGKITSVVQGASKLNLAVRGIYGEGTENQGNLYQISNQSTLGESETEILSHLAGVIQSIINYEKNARLSVLKKSRYTLFDQVGRAYGLLRHAFKLTLPESLQALSSLRLGADLEMFDSVSVPSIHFLFVRTNPAHLSRIAGRPLSGEEADVERAKLFRETLSQLSGGKN